MLDHKASQVNLLVTERTNTCPSQTIPKNSRRGQTSKLFLRLTHLKRLTKVLINSKHYYYCVFLRGSFQVLWAPKINLILGRQIRTIRLKALWQYKDRHLFYSLL